MTRRNSTAFSKEKLYDLEYIQDGNQLPNLDEWIERNIGNKAMSDLYELWKYNYAQIGTATDCPTAYQSFMHELSTVLLNCKLLQKEFSIGFQFGAIAATTYQNNTIPNLIEIGIIWPKWSSNPIDILEELK